MNAPNRARYALTLAIASICAGIYWYAAMLPMQETAAFFSHSLVSVGALAANEEDTYSLRVVQTRYARELALRSPLFDLSGTDPNDLRNAAHALAAVQNELAASQLTAEDTTAVRSLYPIEFLLSLADLEEARRTFIDSGASMDRMRYDVRLADAILIGSHAVDGFDHVFQEIASAHPARFPTHNGSITTESMLATLAYIKEGFENTAEAAKKRGRCLDGHIASCDVALLQTPVPDLPIIPEPSEEMLQNVAAVRSLLAESTNTPDYNTRTAAALASSACVGAASTPPYFFLPAIPGQPVRMQYLNDLFFTTTAGLSAPTIDFLRDSLGITYSRINPAVFYICPDAGRDAAAIRAITATATFALKHPDIAAHVQFPPSGAISLREDAAIRYLRAALEESAAEPASTEAFEELIAVALMFTDRGADLDAVVREIADVGSADLRLKESGVPFDLSAATLFLTHSAFPTLFQSYNPSFGSRTHALRRAHVADAVAVASMYRPYTALRRAVSREKFVRDLSTFFTFEDAQR